MPNKLAKSVLIALIPSSLSQRLLTNGQAAAKKHTIIEALAYLKTMNLIALVMLDEMPVWALTPRGRKVATELRNGGQEGLVLKATQPKLL